jgi:hypothetical protein
MNIAIKTYTYEFLLKLEVMEGFLGKGQNEHKMLTVNLTD